MQKKNLTKTKIQFIFVSFYPIFVSPADVEPPELDSLLDAMDTGLGLRDDAPELGSDAVNWH